jgi:hypothetical protein
MVMTNKGGNDLRRQGDPGNQDFRARGSALERPVRVECGVCDWENQADCDRLIVTIRLCQWFLTFCPWLTAVPSYWDPTTQQRQGLSRTPATSNLFRTDRAASSKIFDLRRAESPQIQRRFRFEIHRFWPRSLPTIPSSVCVQQCYRSNNNLIIPAVTSVY